MNTLFLYRQFQAPSQLSLYGEFASRSFTQRDRDPAIVWATGDHNGSYNSYGDQPAVAYANGTKQWYRHGNLHRDNDLPAITWPSGTKEWYQHDRLHSKQVK